ncbi:MAG: outer membrane beta-barrel protein [Phenylobacterium sp.]
MSTYKRILAAGAAVVVGSGVGFSTAVFAQATGSPQAPVTTIPTPATPAAAAAVPGDNFRRDATISVAQRPREGYEARGIRLGTFMAYPKVTLSAVSDDNIYATSTGQTQDTVWHATPGVSVNSDWIRHAFSAYAQTSINKYQDHSAEDTTDYGVGVGGKLDVTRDTFATGHVDYIRGTEPRTSPNSPASALEPVRYDLWSVGVTGRHEFNRLLAAGRLESQRFDYASPSDANGNRLDQSFRDRTNTTIGGRLDYAVSPATALFVDVQADKHEYKHTGTTSRDSSGTRVQGGVNFEITALVRGDIGVGYIRQSFDDSTQRDLKGFSANGSVEWFPTQLTTVTFNVARTIEDSAVAGSAAYLSTNVHARVEHELLRNVILTGQVGYGKDEYTGIDREDRRKSAGVGVSYLINRTLGLSASYDYSNQKGGSNFTDNRVSATLTVQY